MMFNPPPTSSVKMTMTPDETFAYVAEVSQDYGLDLEVTGVLFEQFLEYQKDEADLTFEQFLQDEFTAAAWMSAAGAGLSIDGCNEAAEEMTEAFS